MSRPAIVSLIGCFALLGAVASQAQPASAKTEQGVATLERQWMQSQLTNNAELLAPLLAEKFVATGADGKVTNRAETLAGAKSTNWTSVEYENLQVTAYGNAAIATGVYVAKGTNTAGKPMDVRERFTDTWLKMPDGKWQCVASHGSAIEQ